MLDLKTPLCIFILSYMAKSKSKLKKYIYIAELHNHRAQMTHSLHKNSYQKNIDLENLNTSLIKGYIKKYYYKQC